MNVTKYTIARGIILLNVRLMRLNNIPLMVNRKYDRNEIKSKFC